MKKLIKKISIISIILFIGMVFFISFFKVLIGFPVVQNVLLPPVTSFVSKQLGLEVSIEAIDLAFPLHVRISNGKVYDKKERLILSFEHIESSGLSIPIMGLIRKSKEPQNFEIDFLQIKKPFLHLYKGVGDSLFNYSGLFPPKESGFDSPSPEIRVGELDLIEGELIFVDSSKISLSDFDSLMNFRHMHLKGLALKGEVMVEGDLLVTGEIDNIGFKEVNSSFSLEQLKGKFDYQIHKKEDPITCEISKSESLNLDGISIISGETELKFDARSDFASFKSLFSKKTNEKVLFDIKPGKFDTKFITHFAGKKNPLRGVFSIEGNGSWNLSRIRLEKTKISYGKNTKLEGRVFLDNYSNTKLLGMDLFFSSFQARISDLEYIINPLELPLNGDLNLYGGVRGGLRQLKSTGIKIKFGEQSELNGRFVLNNLLNKDLLTLDVDILDGITQMKDLTGLIPSLKDPGYKGLEGPLTFSGIVSGNLKNYTIDALLKSDLGVVQSSIALALPQNGKDYSYEGFLSTSNFKFNQIGIPGLDLETLNFTGKIKGTGLSPKTMNGNFSGVISNSILWGEKIDTLITPSLVYSDGKILGEIILIDDKGSGGLNLNIDSQKEIPHFEVYGDVKDLDLNHYGLLSDTILLSGIVNTNINGSNIDDFYGKLRFFYLSLFDKNKKKKFEVNRLIVDSKRDSVSKKLNINSSVLDLKVGGELKYSKFPKLVKKLAKEWRLFVQNDEDSIRSYYENQIPDSVFQEIDFVLEPRSQFSDLASFLGFDMFMSQDFSIKSQLSLQENRKMVLSGSGDSLSVGGISFKDNEIDFEIAKPSTENKFEGGAKIRVGKLGLSDKINFEEVNFLPSFQNNLVDYQIKADQPNLGNSFNLKATTQIFADKVTTSFDADQTYIKVRKGRWRMDSDNLITSSKGKHHLYKIGLSRGPRSLKLDGWVSPESTDLLSYDLTNIDFNSIKEFYYGEIPLEGTIRYFRGGVTGVLKKATLTAEYDILGLDYKTIKDVDLTGGLEYIHDKSEKPLSFVALGHHLKEPFLKLRGRYDFEDKISPAFIRFDSSYVPLGWLESFMEKTLDDLSGKIVVDSFIISGSFDSPSYSGEGHFEKFEEDRGIGVKVKMFNKKYWIPEGTELTFNNKLILIPDLKLTDDEFGDNYALINGNIRHDGFKDFSFDIQVEETKNFELMNTEPKEGELYYGKVVLENAIAWIHGTLEEIEIDADIETGKGTYLSLPISEYSSASRLDFVEFLANGKKGIIEEKRDLSGFILNLNVNATPDATIRLIFDEKVGDIIEASGSGHLSFNISTNGDFVMDGRYEIEKGNYLFTTQNVLNKKFKVSKESSITFNGDPYSSLLDIRAAYEVKAELSDLFGEENQGRVPVDIILDVTGSLAKPEINLSLALNQVSQDQVMELASYFRNIENDKQELNRQVVSLLVFRRFARNTHLADQSGETNANLLAGSVSSISELVSNQLNYWLSQAFDDNFGVEINTNEFSDVELTLRAKLFGDRVTIERNGTLIGNGNKQLSVGNVSVLIKLLPLPENSRKAGSSENSGSLVFEIFNRESVGITSSNTNTTGAGIFFKKDFDNIKDLFGRKE